ncbi:MAG: sigma-70 family RNA polymerase sigma factor [Actinobacteria bacterium]|nr:sigma-70 family RNA polymerase sigma factor [Actinomycetota bacterium]
MSISASEAVADSEQYRRELTGYCYRYFGSFAEAEDAVQETMERAWRRADTFDGRSSLRTWLYRIATNICLDMRKAPQRRALPADLSPSGDVPDDPTTLAVASAETWIGPIGDAHLPALDPADRAIERDSLRLAFLAALQHLPPRQRAVLLLRDVLGWSAQECAELLEISVAAVNSALARARATMAAHDPGARPRSPDEDETELLGRYLAAFEAYDVDRLVELVAEDATFSMPPFSLWLQGRPTIERWWRGPGEVCRGSRTLATRANGLPALAVYHPVSPDRWEPFAVHVVEMADGRITSLTHFMGPDVFAQLGLPEEISATTDQF